MSDDFQQRGGSPWGSPPGSGGNGNGSGRGPTPPDVEKIIKDFQEKIKKFLPGSGSSGGKQAILVLIILGFVALNTLALHAVGSNNPDGVDVKKFKDDDGVPLDTKPFFPYDVMHDLYAIGVFLIFFVKFVHFINNCYIFTL